MLVLASKICMQLFMKINKEINGELYGKHYILVAASKQKKPRAIAVIETRAAISLGVCLWGLVVC